MKSGGRATMRGGSPLKLSPCRGQPPHPRQRAGAGLVPRTQAHETPAGPQNERRASAGHASPSEPRGRPAADRIVPQRSKPAPAAMLTSYPTPTADPRSEALRATNRSNLTLNHHPGAGSHSQAQPATAGEALDAGISTWTAPAVPRTTVLFFVSRRRPLVSWEGGSGRVGTATAGKPSHTRPPARRAVGG